MKHNLNIFIKFNVHFIFICAIFTETMANSELIVAITLIFIGVFYILERVFHLTALCYSWFYDNNISNGSSEPGEETPNSNKYKT